MSVIHLHHGTLAGGDGGLLLLAEGGHVLLPALRLLTGLPAGFLHGDSLPRRYQRLVGQLEDTLDGSVVVADLVDEGAHDVLRVEGLAGEVLLLHHRAVLPDGLAELLAQLVKLGLQLLRVAVGGLAVLGVLLGAGDAHQLDVAVAVPVHGPVRHGPEGAHRADAAHGVPAVHHDRAVAQGGDELAGGAAHAVHPRHGALALLAAVREGLLVVDAGAGGAARRVQDEDVADDLRDGVGVEDLVTVVLGAVRAAVAVARHGTVDDHHVDDLVVVGELLVVPVQVVLDAVDVADIQLVLEAAVPRQEEALPLLALEVLPAQDGHADALRVFLGDLHGHVVECLFKISP